MSSPYLAGSIALYVRAKKGKGKQNATDINEQFQNYATPRKVYKSSVVDTPLRQGAGLVQVYDAITQGTHVSPAKLSFNDTATNQYKTKTLYITNYGSKSAYYELHNTVSTGISPYDIKKSGYTSLELAKDTHAAAKLRFSSNSSKLAPGKTKKVTVTIIPPKTNPRDHIFYGGYVKVKSSHKHHNRVKDIHVPYIGVVGVQKSLLIFDKGFPLVIDTQNNVHNKTFIYDRSVENSFPVIVQRFLTPTAQLATDLVDFKTNKIIGMFDMGANFIPRNFLTRDYQVFETPWLGIYAPFPVSDASLPIPVSEGTYILRYSALKLFGDTNNPKDWEVWKSPPITVKN